MTRHLALLTLGLLVLGIVPAQAQLPRPERPYRGLFGGGTGNWEQRLVATASLGGGWDDNLLADARGGSGRPGRSDLERSFRGSVAQATGSLQYSLSRSRLSLGATAGTSGRYYPSLGDEIYRRDSASVSAGLRLPYGFSANAAAVYMPYSLSSLLLAAPGQDGDDFSMPTGTPGSEFVTSSDHFDLVSSDEHFLTYSGGLGWNQQISRRTSVSGSYVYRASQSSSRRGRQFERQSVGGRVTYAAGRGLNLRAGYRYSDVRYKAAELRRSNHLIDVGADYNRSLSISRRTTLSFGTGTSATTRPEAVNNRTRVRLNGQAMLNHEIGRTWHASVGYSRRVRLDENFADPVFSDSVSASVGGSVSRRVQFNSSLRASTGRVGFESGDFNSYRANASLSVALTRFASLGATYAYYYHLLGGSIALPPGLPAGVDRHSVRAYVNVWAPLFQRSRRSHVTR